MVATLLLIDSDVDPQNNTELVRAGQSVRRYLNSFGPAEARAM